MEEPSKPDYYGPVTVSIEQSDPRMDLEHVTFILGGARSGKSRKAEELVEALPPPWNYVATAEIHDAEMQARIDEHRARRGEKWRTHDAPIELPQTIATLPDDAPVLVDCLTLWLSNLILGGHDADASSDALLAALSARNGFTAVVSNEVGLGIVPKTRSPGAFATPRVGSTSASPPRPATSFLWLQDSPDREMTKPPPAEKTDTVQPEAS